MTAPRAVPKTASAHALDPSVINRWVQRTCEAQGIEVHITDPAVLARIVVLLDASGGRQPNNESR